MCEQGRQNWRDNEMHSDYPPFRPTTDQNKVRIALNDGNHISDCIDGRNPACSGCARLGTIQLSSLAFLVLRIEIRNAFDEELRSKRIRGINEPGHSISAALTVDEEVVV